MITCLKNLNVLADTEVAQNWLTVQAVIALNMKKYNRELITSHGLLYIISDMVIGGENYGKDF